MFAASKLGDNTEVKNILKTGHFSVNASYSEGNINESKKIVDTEATQSSFKILPDYINHLNHKELSISAFLTYYLSI